MFSSFLLDAKHLLKPSLDYLASQKGISATASNPNLQAYQILNTMRLNKGPGIIFTDFLPVQYGHSLFVTTYPFNSAFNPEFDPEKATWAAILTNINYQPFLVKRFPESKWYWVGNRPPSLAGGLTVGILPITSANHGIVLSWVKVQGVFHQLQLEGEGSYNEEKAYEQSVQHLLEGYDAIKGDPFMESCYWEWRSQYFFSPSYSENIAALQNAIQRGYPAVHLYQNVIPAFVRTTSYRWNRKKCFKRSGLPRNRTSKSKMTWK